MHSYTLLVLLATLATTVQSHMYLYTPPTFNSTNNPRRTTPPDTTLNYPYNCCGRTDTTPCKGYLSLLGTPDGAPVATWPAGSTQEFSLAGSLNQVVHGGNHYGGSAQVGFSVDSGRTWKVAATFQGNHPRRNGGEDPAGQTFDFTVPSDMPTGDAVFAWSWVNHDVVREFQMSCAAVTIVNGSQTDDQAAEQSSHGQARAPYPTTLITSGVSASNGTQTNDQAAAQSNQFLDPHPTNIVTVVPDTPSISPSCTCTRDPPQSQPQPPNPIPTNYLRPRSPQISITPLTTNTVPVSFADRPPMLFFMDMASGCIPPPSTAELLFPNPGPNVVYGDRAYPLETPTPADKCGGSPVPSGYSAD